MSFSAEKLASLKEEAQNLQATQKEVFVVGADATKRFLGFLFEVNERGVGIGWRQIGVPLAAKQLSWDSIQSISPSLLLDSEEDRSISY